MPDPGAEALPEGDPAPGSPWAPPVFVVLGMHRSGTSMCSRALSRLGVDMYSEAREGVGNEHGHFERWEVVALHDEILALFDRVYYSPLHDLPLPSEWWADPRVQPLKTRLKDTLAPFLERGRPFGFKDPRTTRLLPMWRDIFFELGLRPRYAVCLRDPTHVAASLHARDGLSQAIGEVRALNYMLDALRFTEPLERRILRFDDWFARPEHNAALLADLIGRGDMDPAERGALLADLVDPAMNRSGARAGASAFVAVRRGYAIADWLARRPDDRAAEARLAEFDRLHAEFQQTAEVHVMLQRELAATIAERTRALEASELKLREARERLDAAEAEATRFAEERDAALARLAAYEAASAPASDSECDHEGECGA